MSEGAAPESGEQLVAALCRLDLLEPTQREECGRLAAARPLTAQELATELLQRGWLTPFQANQLLQGKGASLVVGPYRLLARLGAGGMGEVFKARHAKLGRLVALKLIHKNRTGNPDAVRRFLREVRATAQLHHPNIVAAENAGEDRGAYYLVMELIEGTDLRKRVKQQGPLPPALACDYIRQAALGLQHAFEQGLVHRDVKPGNLLLDTKGTVKLLDLGLARLGPDSELDSSSDLTSLPLGTPDYMAPEQIRDAHTADIRADLYSLGCTFYLLLAGQAPFANDSIGLKLVRHQQEEPVPVEEVRPEVPAALAAVVRKLMAKKPQERYQTPAELAEELKRLLQAGAWTPASPYSGVEGNETAVVTPAWRLWRRGRGMGRRVLASLGVVLGLAALLAAGLFLFRAKPQPAKEAEEPAGLWRLRRDKIAESERFAWQPAELVQILGTHRARHWGRIQAMALHPDGRRLAAGGTDRVVRLWDLETWRELAAMPAPGVVEAIAFQDRGKTLIAGIGGPAPRLLSWQLDNVERPPTEVAAAAHCFSPDGSRALYANAGSCALTETTTGKVLYKRGDSDLAPDYLATAFSPDGKLALASGATAGDIILLDARNGKVLRTFSGAHEVWVTVVAFLSDDLHFVTADSGRFLKLWHIERDKELRSVEQGGYSSLAGFPKRSAVVGVGGPWSMRIWELSGDFRLKAMGRTWLDRVLLLPPEGRRALTADSAGCLQLWDVETGKDLRTIPQLGLKGIAFSPTGDRLVSGSDSDHDMLQIWDVQSGKVLGSHEEKDARTTSVTFAPNGRWVVWGQANGVVTRLDAQTGKVLRRYAGFKDVPVSAVAFDPKSERIYAGGGASSPARECTVRAWEVDSGKEILRFEGHRAPLRGLVVSADGKRLLTCADDASVRLWDTDSGTELSQQTWGNTTVVSVALSPDGKMALSGGHAQVVRLWKLADPAPQPVELKESHRAVVSTVLFTPDGQRLLSAGDDGRILVHDLKGELVGEWQLPGAVAGLALSPDGKHLASANANGTIYILRLPAPPPKKGR